jgi:hypothetical protein
VHGAPDGLPVGGGGALPSASAGGVLEQTPLLQKPPQQPSHAAFEHLPVQLPAQLSPSGTHAGAHFFVVGSQRPPQHCGSVVQSAVMPRHNEGGNPQRGSSKLSWSQSSLLLVSRQQPRWEPELHVSPVGRHVELAASTSQVPPLQTPEQHSALLPQDSLCSLQSWAAHTPSKQPSEQQSCARVHAWPLPRHASVHLVTPA